MNSTGELEKLNIKLESLKQKDIQDVHKYELLYEDLLDLKEKSKDILDKNFYELEDCILWKINLLLSNNNNTEQKFYEDKRIETLETLVELSEGTDKLEKILRLLNFMPDNNNKVYKCNNIICSFEFEGVDTQYIVKIKKIKISTLKHILKDENIDEDLKRKYNKEIIECYDYLILNDDKKIMERKKLEYLKSYPVIKEKTEELLKICDKLKYNNSYDEYCECKMKALYDLHKFSECVEFYDCNVKIKLKNDWCIVNYLYSLYQLRQYNKIEEHYKNIEVKDDIKKILCLRLLLSIAIKEKNKIKMNEILNIANNIKSDKYFMRSDFKCKILENMIKLSPNNEHATYKRQIKDIYYNNIKKSNIFYNNYQVNSNIFVDLLVENDVNGMLYHYTNINALQGILENRQFWVTSADFLNDYKETKHILNYFKVIFNHVKSKQEDKAFIECLEKVYKGLKYYFNPDDSGQMDGLDTLKKYIDNNIKYYLKEIYILSLSTNEDSITLWGNYSNNEGYNLGIDKSEILDCFINVLQDKTVYSNVQSGKIIYKNILKDIENVDYLESDELYRGIEEYYKDCIKNNIDEEKIMCGLVINIIFIGLFIKDKSFSNEEEYRIIFFKNKDDSVLAKTNFRVKNSSFIPYIKVPFNKECIKNICIGPNNRSDISKKGLIEILKYYNFNISDDNIKNSSIPLRY